MDIEQQQVIELPTQNYVEPRFMDQYKEASNGYQYHKQFPSENSSTSNMININFLPTIILPIDKFLKEKSPEQEQDHSPKDVMMMKKEESPKNISDVRVDNAPINIKNLV